MTPSFFALAVALTERRQRDSAATAAIGTSSDSNFLWSAPLVPL